MMSAKEAAAVALARLHKDLVEKLPLAVSHAAAEGIFKIEIAISPLISKSVLQSILGTGYAIDMALVQDGNIALALVSWIPTLEEATALLMPTSGPALDTVQQLSVDATNKECEDFIAKIHSAAKKGNWTFSEMLTKALTLEVLQKRLGPAYKVAQAAEYADDTHQVRVSWHLTPEQADVHLGAK